MQAHIQLIQLIVGYALVGAFVFTVAITCGSLVGWVKFKSPSQQRKLFAVLIVQVCVAGAGFFTNVLKFDPLKVQQEILRDYMSAPGTSARASDFTDSTFVMSKFVRADFSQVLFDNARFEYTSFRRAVFHGSDFSGADLSSITIDAETKLPQR